MRRAFIALLLIATTAAAAPARAPIAVKAEATFFNALNHDAKQQKTALRELTAAFATDPGDPRTTLLLGLGHLWLAAEGGRGNLEALEHVYLSESFLERAQKLAPEDGRIPSWLVPARMAIAGVERDKARREVLMGDLLAAYAKDPDFHSFTVAFLGFDHPRESEDFQRGLRALRAAIGCTDDPSCRNETRWPHNMEGFETFIADYELKAGEPARAKELLEKVKAMPAYATFLYPEEVEDRLANLTQYAALYANADRRDDPPSIMADGRSCRSCHATK
jgi:hypothetical protein